MEILRMWMRAQIKQPSMTKEEKQKETKDAVIAPANNHSKDSLSYITITADLSRSAHCYVLVTLLIISALFTRLLPACASLPQVE